MRVGLAYYMCIRSSLVSTFLPLCRRTCTYETLSGAFVSLNSKDLNVAVVLVNQCMSDPGAMAMFATVKPVGGHVLAHASTTRVHLKKGRVRKAEQDSLRELNCIALVVVVFLPLDMASSRF